MLHQPPLLLPLCSLMGFSSATECAHTCASTPRRYTLYISVGVRILYACDDCLSSHLCEHTAHCACESSRPAGDVPPGCHFISHLFYLLHSSFFIQLPADMLLSAHTLLISAGHSSLIGAFDRTISMEIG